MFDKIKELFNEGLQYTHTAAVLQQIGNLLQIIGPVKEGTKNAALDTICEILQSHKDAPVASAEAETNAVN